MDGRDQHDATLIKSAKVEILEDGIDERFQQDATLNNYVKVEILKDDIDNVTRGARTRGAQGGRGMRVLLPVAAEAGGVPRAGGIRGGRGGRGSRGGRGARTSRVRTSRAPSGPNRRSGPSTVDEITIRNIEELPTGQGLETPLHPKRMRLWQPSQTDPIPAPQGDEVPRPTGSDSPGPQSPAVVMPPSRAMYVEYHTQPPTPPSPPISRPHCSRQNLNEDENDSCLNLGSEGSSDESGCDDELVPTLPSRVFRSMLDTPEDEFDDVPAAPAPIAVDVVSAETHQPHSFYDFTWNEFPNVPIQPELRRETFSENIGPTIPHVDPYDIFVTIWDRQLMEYIASETNRYAQQVVQQMMDNNNLNPNSRICRWQDTTADELYVYFAMIIAMGVVVKSRVQEYWSTTSDIFYTPGFAAHMSINRFVLLNKLIHFNNNDMCAARARSVSEAKLFKIEPILSHLNQKFQSIYNLSRNLSLDESLLQWKGWLDINQLVPNKAAVIGIKSYEICESQTGYLWRFEIHAHKRTPQQQPEEPLNASTPSIVLRLTHGLENKGHTLWMDNFYNSPSLARRLKASGIDCVGTLRTNRPFVPQALHNLTKGDMRKGQICGLTSGDVDVMVWRDANRVAMLSTYHGNATKQVRGSTKPILILDYNIMMGGVDKKDQMLAMFPIERKRTKVWYKKLFRRLLNVSILNSYIIHHHSSSSLSHRNFRTTLVTSLLSKHTSFVPLFPRPSAITTQTRPADINHRIAEYPLEGRYRKRRLCQVCKKRVHSFCVGCSKTVCLDPCFVSLHS